MSDTAIAQTNNSLDENRPSTVPKAETPNDIKDNGNAQQGGDESTPAKKLKLNDVIDESVKEKSVTPAKPGRQKGSTKRLNILEKTAKEAEALLQNMGHKSDEDDGRRRTRSQTRGTPAPSAVAAPTKKAATPKTPTKESTSGGPKRRGRPPKNVVQNNSVEDKTDSKNDSEEKSESTEETTNETSEKAVNNTNKTKTNDSTASQPEVTPSEEPPKESAEEKPSAGPAKAATEQTNDVSAKTKSLSDDTSKSVPIIDTHKTTTE